MSDLSDPNHKPTPKPAKPEPINKSELPPSQQAKQHSSPSSKLPMWLLPALIAVLVIGVLLGRFWGGTDAESQTTPASAKGDNAVMDVTAGEQAVLSVETVQPSQDTIGNTLSADGAISAKDTANVSAKVSGVAVERVLVEEGDQVAAGQVLAIFDTDAMAQQVLQAEADVAEAEATLANASADAARILPLLDIDAISQQEADRYRTSEVRARASLQAAKARLNNQRLTLDNAKVTAPVKGVISEKRVEVGMVAGGEPLFTIIKNGVLEWRADMDPKLIGDISIGTPVKVSLPRGQSVMGQVRRIAPTADNNRQITIYASLAANPAVRAGMYQTGEFLLGSDSMQTVPNSTIVSNDGYDYVMMVTQIRTTREERKLGRIQQQRVTLGERIGDSVVLTEPLPADSRLVKQGGSFLNDGDLVRIVDGLNESTTTATDTSQVAS